VAKTPLRLAIFDIDGTLRRVRDPWIHLHHHLGVADLAKDLPELWHRGEISYEEWARLDASFWRGNSRERLVAALEASPLREGARELVGWFIHREIPCVGISSGLSVFNDITARELGIHEVISNELYFDGDIFNGGIAVKVHEHKKAEIMDQIMDIYSVRAEESVAFGDGTADIPLLHKAGLGVAICPVNERVRFSAEYVVEDEPIDSAVAFVERHFRVRNA
jgi:phosphoserine phosphatase